MDTGEAYYAGFPTSFVHNLIVSASLPEGAVVLDPWNGSGTTTFAASRLGFDSLGADINPVMVLIARARLLPPSEANSIRPLARDVVVKACEFADEVASDDPLRTWFNPAGARAIRAVEAGIRRLLIDLPDRGGQTVDFGAISGIAATLYVGLFSVARNLARSRRSSNPTWLRQPRSEVERIGVETDDLHLHFNAKCSELAGALEAERSGQSFLDRGPRHPTLAVFDSTLGAPFGRKADLVVTSPPYCTRIDYAASTRIELAVIAPLIRETADELARAMMGSTRVPIHKVRRAPSFGPTCYAFLDRLRIHPSKASSGYYYRTHVDYFSKLSRSLRNLSGSLRQGGGAVLVVQDSHYKDIHNDLPTITTEMAESCGLRLEQRCDFHLSRTLAGVHPGARQYRKTSEATEAVLCFSKHT